MRVSTIYLDGDTGWTKISFLSTSILLGLKTRYAVASGWRDSTPVFQTVKGAGGLQGLWHCEEIQPEGETRVDASGMIK